MRSYYIYLVEINHSKFGCLHYVGSHSWKGPSGQLDPNYHGSSGYRYYKNWISKYKFSESILEVVDKDTVYERERFWILKVLNEKGSFLKGHKVYNNSWLNQFDKGSCLNGHAGGGEHLRSDKARKNYLKWYKSHSSELSTQAHLLRISMSREDLSKASKKANLTMGKEGLYKRTQTRLSNMGTEGCSELCRRSAITRGNHFKHSAIKGVKTRSGTKTLLRTVSVNGVIYNSILSACSAIGHKNWNSMISQHFCKGEEVVVRKHNNKEYVFKVESIVKEKDYNSK